MRMDEPHLFDQSHLGDLSDVWNRKKPGPFIQTHQIIPARG